VITRTTLEKPNEYCLFFPVEKGGEIMLEEKRTIASYRLNSHTLLHFKKISKSITATQKPTQRLYKLLGTAPLRVVSYFISAALRASVISGREGSRR
jgi:hypothetical protein